MKKILSPALLITLTLSLLILTGCDFLNFSSEKEVPVYKGMSITASNNVAHISQESSGVTFGENYSGDTSDISYGFDKENPFPDNAQNETIEEAVNSSIDVPGAVNFDFYASANQDVYINLHFYNPDGLEIASLTLNGTVYTSDMFDPVSDSETVYVKQNVGSVSGVQKYEISDIKYRDGKEEKDVIMDGNVSLLAGVKSTDLVTVGNVKTDASATSVSVSFDLLDSGKLLAVSKGTVKAVLYDGKEIIETRDLKVGGNKVEFTNLSSRTVYQYAIVAYYDDLSGSGFCMQVIHKEAFITEAVLLFDKDSITVNKSGIDFDFIWNDDHENKLIQSITIYKGDEKLQMFGGNRRSIDNLLSDTSYKLVVSYILRYDESGKEKVAITESITLEFKTLPKSAPTVKLSWVDKTRTTVEFGIDVTDVDNVATTITLIELVYKGIAIDTISGNDIATKRVFENLTHDTTYTVRATYTYDLCDGTGEKTATATVLVSTLYIIPSFEIKETSKTQTGFSFEIKETDRYNYGEVTNVTLKHNDEILINDNTGTVRSFDGLLSNNEYTVIVEYVYDLEDGTPKQTVTKELKVTTKAKAIPVIDLKKTTTTQTSIGFNISVIEDRDNIAKIESIELFLNGALKVAEDLTGTVRGFEGLLSDNEYTVALTYSYDLNDGKPRTFVTDRIYPRTDAKVAPEFSIENLSKTGSSIEFEIHETDVDNVGGVSEINLIKPDGSAITAESLDKRCFEGLAPCTLYTLQVKYIYDLNDGLGAREVIKEISVKTDHYLGIQEFSIANPTYKEGETISLDIKLNNPSSIIVNSVVINGITYSVTDADADEIHLDIPCDSRFVGGDTFLSVEKIIGSCGEEAVSLVPDGKTSSEVFIYGKIELLGVSFVNTDFEPIDWARPRDTVYLLVTLSNPTGYEIKGFTRYDDDRWYYPVSLSYGWNSITVSSLNYARDDVSGSLSFPEVTTSIYRVSDDYTGYITTPEQLMNMADGHYYELLNDLDLSDIEWIPSDFEGVFNGNGYTIKNLSVSLAVTNSNAYAGLFAKGTGIISNLNLSGKTISISASSDDGCVCNAFAGGLVAYGTGLDVYGCSIDISYIKATSTYGNAYAGGLVGYASNAIITDCRSDADVIASYSAGGLAGFVKDTIIKNCENLGSIGYIENEKDQSVDESADEFEDETEGEFENSIPFFSAGGLVGYISNTSIYDSKNSGSISYAVYCGGIAGASKLSTIERCHNSGSIDGIECSDGLVGFSPDGNTTITDSTSSGNVKS